MGYFVLFLVFSLVLFVLSQPREVLNEIWRDIEEYEEMKRTGFKPLPKESNEEGDGEGDSRSGGFRANVLLDLLFFIIVVILFGFIGYFLSSAI